MMTWIPWAILMDKWCQNEHKWRLEYHEQYGWTNDAKMSSNEDLNPMSNIDGHMVPKWTQVSSNEDLNLISNMHGQMMPKWTQMKTWIPWAIWMDKWCQNELKWRLESHEQYGWTNDAKMNTNDDLNPMSNIDGQMMPKWTQMKTWIPWAILMDKWCQNELKWTQMKTWISYAIWMVKWCQNELKWRLESHEQYGCTNVSKMNSNEDLNIMSNMDGQMMPKWTQMKTWIPWTIWMDKCFQNELKWRLECHEQYGCTNDSKMNSNEDLNIMSNMDGQMLPKWTQMKTWIPWTIWMDKWYQNELKWRLEYHEQYGWTNAAKMNSNEDLNPMNNMDGQMMPKWTQMNSNEGLNLCRNIDGEMMPKWTPLMTRISWAIWIDKCCQNELKWRLEYHEQYGWTNDAKMNSNEDFNPMSNIDGHMMPKWTQVNSNEDLNLICNMDGQMMPKWTQMKTWIPWAIWMYKCFQNELKWRLEYHEQYGWTNDAKMNSNEDLNPMNNMDGQMFPKWTQMKTWMSWAIWMYKWFQNELKWRLEYHEQYGWTNAAKMNSNEDLNPMNNMDGQMIPKWTQMKTWISWAIWMDKCCQNELKWRLESHEQYGWTNDAKMNSNELKWRLESLQEYWWRNDAKMNSTDDSNIMSNMDRQMLPKWTQMKTWIPWAIWMDKWCQNELKWRL